MLKPYRFFQCEECVADERKVKQPRRAPKAEAAPELPSPSLTVAKPPNKASAKSHSAPSRDAEIVRLQEQIKFFQQLNQQSHVCRLQLSARQASFPAASTQAESISVQIRQLVDGEVFHKHKITQAQQQLHDLLQSGAVDASVHASDGSIHANGSMHGSEGGNIMWAAMDGSSKHRSSDALGAHSDAAAASNAAAAASLPAAQDPAQCSTEALEQVNRQCV